MDPLINKHKHNLIFKNNKNAKYYSKAILFLNLLDDDDDDDDNCLCLNTNLALLLFCLN